MPRSFVPVQPQQGAWRVYSGLLEIACYN
jgi:hypothetical protein